MSKPRFDSSRMLPLFCVITPNKMNAEGSTMPTSDVHHKHKRKTKRLEVPIHNSASISHANSHDNIPIHKSYSANFPAQKSEHKSNHKHEKISFQNEDELIEDSTIEKPKVKRKYLIKENDRISTENQNLFEQLTLAQNEIMKKDSNIMKLKEKYTSIQTTNKDLLNENNLIKTQYQHIADNLEEFKIQMQNFKCEKCEELRIHLKTQINNLDVTKTTNKDLNEDLNMLKNVIYRLNVQLERYQQILRKSNALTASNNMLNMSPLPTDIEQDQNEIVSQLIDSDSAYQHTDHLHSPISWGKVNSHTLGPLLDAYQHTIIEKEDIIQKYEFELVTFTDKLKTVIEENEILHRKSIADTEVLKKNITELEVNRKELKVTKEQNDLLIKKCALKHDKLQEICRIYDHKIENMRRDYEVLQEQYHKTRVDLSSLQAKYQSLTDVNDTLKFDKQNVIPISIHTTSVNECKRLFEELKTQYDNEKSKLMNQIKVLEEHSKEFEAKVVEIGSEKRDLQIKIKTAEKQIKKLEAKIVENKNVLTHTQISRDACKRQLGKAIEFGRELVTEQESLLQQLSNRHKENKAVKQIGSSIVNRMDFLKSQLKTVQKDAYEQLATVEQRIQDQDSSIESMRKDHESEIGKLLLQIRDKDDYISKLIEQSTALPPAPYLLFREKHLNLS